MWEEDDYLKGLEQHLNASSHKIITIKHIRCCGRREIENATM